MTNREFLEKAGLGENCVDMERFLSDFLSEMEKGLAAKNGASLMMLPTYQAAEGVLTPFEPVTVLDAGGTNLRAAKVMFDENGSAVILDSAYSLMPGHDGKITADQLFDAFAEAARPMLGETGKIVLCFSFAFEYRPGGEGVILELSKEIEVEDAAGRKLGEGLIAALRRRGVEGPLSVKVINDTDAVLTAALTTGARNAIGFILGTGTNTAYIEKTANIGKIKDGTTQRMSVNIESGSFALGDMAAPDVILNETSVMKDYHLHEKKVAGAYLGRLIAVTAALAAQEGLGSPMFAAAAERASYPMAEVGRFLEGGPSELDAACGCPEDRELMRDIILAVERRAGKLAAGNLAAVMLRMRRSGLEGEIVIEENGTTFAKTLPLRKACMDAMEEMRDRLGDFRFNSIENDTLVGTAAAAFLA